MKECHTTWSLQTSEAVALREEYSNKAVELNKLCSEDNVVAVPSCGEPNDERLIHTDQNQPKLAYIPPIQVWSGCGAMSIGDSEYGISACLLSVESDKPGFVKQGSLTWASRSGGTVSSTDTFATPMRLSCLEEFGFCWLSVKRADAYCRVEKHFIRFVQDFRKKLTHKKRNLGPNAEIKQPLLIAFDEWLVK